MPTLIDILIFLTAILGIIIALRSRRRPKNFPPGPISLPFIGNLHQLGTRPFVTFMEMRKKYGDVFAIDFASYRAIVINDYKMIREALAMPECSSRPPLRPFVEKCGGIPSGIIMNNGTPWIDHRRFTLKNLRDFGFGRKSMETLIQDEVQELLQTMTDFKGRPFETKYLFHLAVVNSLWWIITGERFAHGDEKLKEIVKLFADGLSESPAAGVLFFFPWLSRLAPDLTGYNSFMGFQFASTKLIKEKYVEQKASFKSGQHRHFMDVYTQQIVDCNDPNSAFYGEEGERQLVESITDVFMGGIETTSTTLSWTFLLLAMNPHVQEKLFQEIKSVVGLSRIVTLEDESNLPYTSSVITEVLRFSSIFPLSIFHCTTEDITFQGYNIPKNTMVVPNLHGAHHDPKVWGDPDTFRPERFLTESGSIGKGRDEFMAFSTGKRVCIGEKLARHELFLFTATIFQKFKVVPNPEKQWPVLDYTATFIMQPKSYEYVVMERA